MSLLEVGPDKSFANMQAAMAAAAPGDTVGLVPITYRGADAYVGVMQSGITIRSLVESQKFVLDCTPVGTAKYSATPSDWRYNGKGAITTANECVGLTLEDAEIFGMRNSSSNGSAIRHQGTDLTMRRVYTHHCEINILSSSEHGGNILLEDVESAFARGGPGIDQGHNIYINPCGRLTVTRLKSHDCFRGHLLKSRARETIVTGSVFWDGECTKDESSMHIDCSGGLLRAERNLFHKRRGTSNARHFIYFYTSRDPTGPHHVEIAGNYFVADVRQASDSAYWLDIKNDAAVAPPISGFFRDNILITVDPDIDLGPNFTESKGRYFFFYGKSPLAFDDVVNGTVSADSNKQYFKGATVFSPVNMSWMPSESKPLPVETMEPQWEGELPKSAPMAPPPVQSAPPVDPCASLKLTLDARLAQLAECNEAIFTITAERDALKIDLKTANQMMDVLNSRIDAALAALQPVQ